MKNTIVALITGNVSRANEPTQFLLDRTHADYPASGLHKESVVNCSNLITVRDVVHIIAKLLGDTMDRIDACLKAALGLR
jgi:hypothetical protein